MDATVIGLAVLEAFTSEADIMITVCHHQIDVCCWCSHFMGFKIGNQEFEDQIAENPFSFDDKVRLFPSIVGIMKAVDILVQTVECQYPEAGQ